MKLRRDVLIAVLVTFCLTLALFAVKPIGSQIQRQYDPWMDINDDGIIDYMDIVSTCRLFGTTGTPINKTALLLECLSKIDSLNSSLQGLKAYVETHMPRKGRVIISPFLFQPRENTQSYFKYAVYLRGDKWFETVLQLPNGAIITNVTAKVTDMVTDGYVFVWLRRYPLTGGYEEMAYMETTKEGTPGDIVLYDDTISYASIDNQNYIYSLTVWFAYDTVFLNLQWVIIEYEYP
jgi:hypothetical protein